MRLSDALGIGAGDVVAFVGAGGKSSAIRITAGELAAAGLKVLALPTTKMTVRQAERIGPALVSEDVSELAALVREKLAVTSPVVAGSGIISKERIGGLGFEEVERLSREADVLLVEADGARGRPVKGTAEHEPAIPDCATLAVAIAGINSLGKPVTEEYVHRPELFSVQTGVGPGQSITARAIARSLADGSLAELPGKTEPVVLITGVTPGDPMSEASIVARELWRFGIRKVVLTSLTAEEDLRVWIP